MVKSCAATEAVMSPVPKASVMVTSSIHPVQELIVKTSNVISADVESVMVVAAAMYDSSE